MGSPVDLSIIIPLFNEADAIPSTYDRLKKVMDSTEVRYELLFVDDGSTDASTRILHQLAENDPLVKVLILSRNFGQQAALTAGIDFASGRAVVLIDGDLQDPPELIPRMLDKWKEGFEVVYAKRIKRKGESFAKKMEAALFYRLLNILTDRHLPVDVGDFRLMDRKVCEAIRHLPERNRFLRGLVSWVGFKQVAVVYEREERSAGTSKYFFAKRAGLALDAMLSFSHMPLALLLCCGTILLVTGLIAQVAAILQAVWARNDYSILFLFMAGNLFFSGILLTALGIVGGYIARIHDEIKGRPLYIVADKIGFCNAS